MTTASLDADPEQPVIRSLYVLRHAKSSWESPELADHDRPLDPRGERAALVMGRFITQRHFLPDRVLCSTATRARETLALAAGQWPCSPVVDYSPRLYLNGERELIRVLMAVDDDIRAVLIVGHNPDLHDLVTSLARRGDAPLLAHMGAKFPTAAFAAIKLPLAHWAGIGQATGSLTCFATPKELI